MLATKFEAQSDSGKRLLRLAVAAFGELSKAERMLAEGAAGGRLVRCDQTPEESVTPSAIDQAIRADFVRWLCVTPEALELIDIKGIIVEGARIEGRLDLAFATLKFPLILVRCVMAEGLDLNNAVTRRICLDGSRCAGLTATGIRVQGSLLLSAGFRAVGPVNLAGAEISGNLQCSGGRFLNRKSVAIMAERAHVGGRMFLDAGFRAYGEITLNRTVIEADLDCSGGTVFNRGQVAINAEGARIGGDVRFGHGFRTNGLLIFHNANVVADLSFRGAAFFGAARNGLDASGATVTGMIEWLDVGRDPGTLLDLSHATAAQFVDDEKSWPATGNLRIDGFVYAAFTSDHGARERLRWLARQPDFRPQPYRQLAKVLVDRGQEQEAREVGIAKERARLGQATMGPLSLTVSWLFGLLTGFGYKSWRILYVPLVFVIAGWILFGAGYKEGVIYPVYEHAYQEFKNKHTVPESYPPFDSLVYTLDTFLPLTDFHQEEYWRPMPHRSCTILGRELPCGDILSHFLGIHILAGWIFAIVGVAGILTHKD